MQTNQTTVKISHKLHNNNKQLIFLQTIQLKTVTVTISRRQLFLFKQVEANNLDKLKGLILVIKNIQVKLVKLPSNNSNSSSNSSSSNNSSSNTNHKPTMQQHLIQTTLILAILIFTTKTMNQTIQVDKMIRKTITNPTATILQLLYNQIKSKKTFTN
jgi:hypothetical protein